MPLYNFFRQLGQLASINKMNQVLLRVGFLSSG